MNPLSSDDENVNIDLHTFIKMTNHSLLSILASLISMDALQFFKETSSRELDLKKNFLDTPTNSERPK